MTFRRWFLQVRRASRRSSWQALPTAKPSCSGRHCRSFAEHGADNIRDFFRVFLQMAVVLTFAGAQPVVKIGRIAGQFAKPRSSDNEVKDGVTLPSYRGDIINATAFDPVSRTPDPARQEMAYRQSAATLNLLRAFAQGGYANLENVHKWMLGFVSDSPQGELTGAGKPLPRQWTSCVPWASPRKPTSRCAGGVLHSHEALLLGYEEALTRVDSASSDWYDLRPHDLDRRSRATRTTHMSNIAAVSKSLGLMRPVVTQDGLLQLIDLLNPENEAGRLPCPFASLRQGGEHLRSLSAQSRGPQGRLVLRPHAATRSQPPATRRARSSAS